MSRKENSRQWARLRILCTGSLHLMTLIPDALELVRELIPNSASQLFVVPMQLRIWRALGSVELSPQQTEVAFWMGVGGGRDAARAKMDVSDAVLRDCVKAVYDKFGCTSEAGLLALLRPAVSRM